jgi:hypothetical protein
MDTVSLLSVQNWPIYVYSVIELTAAPSTPGP